MKVMHAFALARYEEAIWRLDQIVELLEGPIGRVPREMVLKTRGDLVAMKLLLELEEELSAAKTQPALRVVK